MRINGTEIDAKVEAFLLSVPRYKLLVLTTESFGYVDGSVDVGRELSMAISAFDRNNEIEFQFAVQKSIREIVNAGICRDEKFGKYVILANPGILFEPDLHLDVCELLKSFSKNMLVFLAWPGVVRQDRLCFLSEMSDISINQSDINYAIL